MVRAEFFRERFLVSSASDAHCFKPHLGCKLHTQMSQPADAENANEVSRPRSAIAQRIECSDACAQEWPRVDGGKFSRDRRERRCGGQHVFRVAAIASQARDLASFAARNKIAATARIA